MKTKKTIGFLLFGITTFGICQYSGLEILSILLPPQGNQRFILRQSSLDCIQAFISYLGLLKRLLGTTKCYLLEEKEKNVQKDK